MSFIFLLRPENRKKIVFSSCLEIFLLSHLSTTISCGNSSRSLFLCFQLHKLDENHATCNSIQTPNSTRKRVVFPTVKFMHIYMVPSSVGSIVAGGRTQWTNWYNFEISYYYLTKIIRVKQLFKWCEIRFMLLFSLGLFWLLVSYYSGFGLVCNYRRS